MAVKRLVAVTVMCAGKLGSSILAEGLFGWNDICRPGDLLFTRKNFLTRGDFV